MSINFQELRELLSAIAQTNITELTLKSEEFELMVRKGTTSVAQEAAVATVGLVQPIASPAQTAPAPTSPGENGTSEPEKTWVEITSPMVGTFYLASAPGESPFVAVGDHIGQGQTVCIIEAMKLMNEIEAEVSGKVMKISVENGDPVEYGQILMWVEPE